MPFLAKAKLRAADNIDSRSLRADAMETLTCGYLAWILLLGLALNAVTHWWWIDSVASLAIVPLLIREGWESVFEP
jgi:divalent metal cation (Fe/Co/Zn/Cd) transporter